MPERDKVSRCFLSVTLFMFLMALAVSVTPVADLDGTAHQSATAVSDTKRGRILAAGTRHGPITIDGDANFSATALLEGWPGDGSPENPFIIDGLEIDLGGNDGSCIRINSTRVSFIISNCNLTGASPAEPMDEIKVPLDFSKGAGIRLENVTNAELVNNTFSSNWYGIYLELSEYNTVENNTCFNNSAGIAIVFSGNNTVVHSICSNNWCGIGLWVAYANTVANNICNNSIVGIGLGFSSYNTVANNICFSNDEYGIYLYQSGSNTVMYNTCNYNRIGIYLYYSESSIVANNNCFNNREHAILEEYRTTESDTIDPVEFEPLEVDPVVLLLVGVVGIIMLGAGWRMAKLLGADISETWIDGYAIVKHGLRGSCFHA